MKHGFKVKVFPGDTDCYGVVWHGAYLKWLEAGRIEILEQIDIKFQEMSVLGILMPVTELKIRYKHFARAYDELSIETSIKELAKARLTFYQEIKNINTGDLILHAAVTGVTTDKNGKLYRVIPDYLQEKLEAVSKHILKSS